MLRSADGLYGPVIVQLSYLLKHPSSHRSPVAYRRPVPLEFLRGREWQKMRYDWLALKGTVTDESIAVRMEMAALATDDARFSVHA